MLKYSFELPASEYWDYIQEDKLKKDKSVPNTYRLIGTAWLKPMEQQVKLKENNNTIKLSVSKTRLYGSSQRADFFTVYAYCKLCYIRYNIKLQIKPTSENSLSIFHVEKNREHAFNDHITDIKKYKTMNSLSDSTNLKSISALFNENSLGNDQSNDNDNNLVNAKFVNSNSLTNNNNHINNSHFDEEYDDINYNTISNHNEDSTKKCTLNWMTSLLQQADIMKMSIRGKVVSGYVHDVQFHEKFSMTLNLEEQLVALHAIPINQRVIHIDTVDTGLIRLHDSCTKQLMLTIIGQDMEILNQGKHLLVSETSTSNLDICTISRIFLKLKLDFSCLFPNEQKLGSILVLDLSWPVIHSACNILNNESFVDYNNRMFRLANGDTAASIRDKIFLASCRNSTMKRFMKALKEKNIFNEAYSRAFGVKCFGLMLNCDNLDSLSNVFKLICSCFLNSKLDNDSSEDRKNLENMIENDPELCDYADKMIRSIYGDNIKPILNHFSSFNDAQSSDEDDDEVESKHFLKPKNMMISLKNIKVQSLFNYHFMNIYQGIISIFETKINMESFPNNSLVNINYIEFLLNYFMPYCGIWARFFSKELNNPDKSLIRITNDVIENHSQYKKRKLHLPQNPSNYISTTINWTRSQALAAMQFYSNRLMKFNQEIQSDTDFFEENNGEDIISDFDYNDDDDESMKANNNEKQLQKRKTFADPYMLNSTTTKQSKLN